MLYSSLNIGSAKVVVEIYSVLLTFTFKIIAMITERHANNINGNENPPIEYNNEPITGPDRDPKDEKNSANAIF